MKAPVSPPKGRRVPFPGTARRALVALAALYEGDTLLDLRAGGGPLLRRYRRKCPPGVILCGACDSPEHTRRLRERMPEVDLMYAPPDDLPWLENSVDVVVCVPDGLLLSCLGPAMEEAQRVLRPGGQLLIALRRGLLPPAGRGKGDPTEVFVRLLRGMDFTSPGWTKAGWGWRVLSLWKRSGP